MKRITLEIFVLLLIVLVAKGQDEGAAENGGDENGGAVNGGAENGVTENGGVQNNETPTTQVYLETTTANASTQANSTANALENTAMQMISLAIAGMIGIRVFNWFKIVDGKNYKSQMCLK